MTLKELAARAVEGDRAMKEAFADERGALVEFLDSLKSAMEECLSAIVSKVPSAERGSASEYGATSTKATSYFPWKGVLVAGIERPAPPDPRVAFERLEGRGLYLSKHAGVSNVATEAFGPPGSTVVFVEVTFRGEIRRGGEYEWVAADVPMSSSKVAEARWPALEIMRRLDDELRVQVAGKRKVTEKALRAAEAVRKATRILASAGAP